MEVKVSVIPAMRREKITKVDAASFKIEVREKAEGNRANMRVREIVAELFSLTISRVHIVRGHRGRNKIIRLT